MSQVPADTLVTGGAGFIGANTVRLLEAEGHAVTVLDDFSVGRRAYMDGTEAEIVKGSILDQDTLEALIPDHDAVVHLAASTGVPQSIEDPLRDFRCNVEGTLNVLEATRRMRERGGDPPALVLASSNAPLGRQDVPATEDKAPLPIAPYGASKLAAEGYCLAYAGSWDIPTVVLRFGNVYGPYSAHKSSVVAQFFKDILDEASIEIHGDGEQTRDFIYVEDLARAILAGIESAVQGEVFQIATGHETSINELADLTTRIVERDVDRERAAPRKGDIRENYSSIVKARDQLKWEPRVDLEEGLTRTWRWFRAFNGD